VRLRRIIGAASILIGLGCLSLFPMLVGTVLLLAENQESK
jgi:hypothetical protein